MSVENNIEPMHDGNRAGIKEAALITWFQDLTTQLPELSAFGSADTAETVSGDASFRSYYRVRNAADSLILMDSAADRASVSPFLSVAETLRQAGVSVPRILAADIEHTQAAANQD